MAHDERDPLDRRQLLRGIVAGVVSLGFVAVASAQNKDETYASNEDPDGTGTGSTVESDSGGEADRNTERVVHENGLEGDERGG